MCVCVCVFLWSFCSYDLGQVFGDVGCKGFGGTTFCLHAPDCVRCGAGDQDEEDLDEMYDPDDDVAEPDAEDDVTSQTLTFTVSFIKGDHALV